MRMQGVNNDGEPLSSAFVERMGSVFDPTVWYPEGPSLTRTEFADECDINILMDRYEQTTIPPANVNRMEPQYLDLVGTPDLQQSLQIMADATEAFMRLPAKVRREFDNDPTRFVAFAQSPDNIEQLREWGLAEPLPVDPPPQRVEIVNPSELVEPGKA